MKTFFISSIILILTLIFTIEIYWTNPKYLWLIILTGIIYVLVIAFMEFYKINNILRLKTDYEYRIKKIKKQKDLLDNLFVSKQIYILYIAQIAFNKGDYQNFIYYINEINKSKIIAFC